MDHISGQEEIVMNGKIVLLFVWLFILMGMFFILHEEIHGTFCDYWHGTTDRKIHITWYDMSIYCTLQGDDTMQSSFNTANAFWDIASYMIMFFMITMFILKAMDMLQHTNQFKNQSEINDNERKDTEA
jgi:uncharacterized protein YhhL (DUF1145 family)